jgi:PAS domain S-box-containing protein
VAAAAPTRSVENERLGKNAPFRILADHLPALCFIADPVGAVIWCNRRWFDYTGVAPDADVDRIWPEVHQPDMLAEIYRRWSGALKAGVADEMVLPLKGADGRFRPFLTRTEPVRHADGQISCWLGTMTEITQQQEVERHQRFLLTLSDRLTEETDPLAILYTIGEALAAHLDAARVGYGQVAEDGETVDAGGRGWTRPDMPGTAGTFRLDDYGAPAITALRRGKTVVIEDTAVDGRVSSVAAAHLALGIRATITVPLVKRGGLAAIFYVHSDLPRQWCDAEVQLVRDTAERAWATLERARSEAALRMSEERLRAIVEATPECVKIVGRDGRLSFMNPAGLVMIEADAANGLPVASVLAPEHREDWRRHHERVCAGESLTWEFDVIGLRGTRRRMETHAVPLASNEGGWEQLAVTRDVTERKRAEEALERSREALHQSEKLTALGSLLAGVSHELNNPLAIVVSLSALLEQQSAGTPFAERATKIRAAAGRCARIVQTFLAMARQRPPERTRVDLNAIVRSALDLAGYGLRTADIAVTADLCGELPDVVGHADQLAQVLLNLIVNAQHALADRPDGRRLTLLTRRNGDCVRVLVHDNGPGVSPEAQRRIFEPFYTTKPMGSGTGLGLSFSLGVAEAHGGKLELEERPGGGACFVLTLPAAQKEASTPSSITETAPDTPQRGRALVVDDEPDVAEALAALLVAEGLSVDLATSGRDAQRQIASTRYDLILSDLRMPDLDGTALFAWLQEKYPNLATRTAFVTGDTLGPAAARFLAASGRPVLEKPFDPGSVRHLLDELAAPKTVLESE